MVRSLSCYVSKYWWFSYIDCGHSPMQHVRLIFQSRLDLPHFVLVDRPASGTTKFWRPFRNQEWMDQANLRSRNLRFFSTEWCSAEPRCVTVVYPVHTLCLSFCPQIQRADDLGLPPRTVIVRRDYFSPEEKELYLSLFSDAKRQFTTYLDQGTVLNSEL
jgi:hypothetical protein